MEKNNKWNVIFTHNKPSICFRRNERERGGGREIKREKQRDRGVIKGKSEIQGKEGKS